MAAITAERDLPRRGPVNKRQVEVDAAEVGNVFASGTLVFYDAATGKINRVAAAGDKTAGVNLARVTPVAGELIEFDDGKLGSEYLMNFDAGAAGLRKLVFIALTANDPHTCVIAGAAQTNFPSVGKAVERVGSTATWVRLDDRAIDTIGIA